MSVGEVVDNIQTPDDNNTLANSKELEISSDI